MKFPSWNLLQRLIAACGLLGVFGLSAQCPSLAEEAPARVDFASEIRPILSNHCYRCHGPDEDKREAGLRLDVSPQQDPDSATAIVPGDPQASELLERVLHTDPDLRMPPAEAGPSLSAEEIALLERWIAQGAEYTQHWAFQSVRKPDVPSTPDPAGWVRNPIDAFVLQKLTRRGITPAPQAARETLIRRVHLDLLGLPPSLAELEQYLADDSPQAYENMVERALSSPHYGERWGRHWLDQARYADTNGYTIDSERSIWPYRDWVIQALNEDKPFDEFTIEQLAGDLLPEPTRDQLIATGFHRNTLVNQEGGTDAEQFRNEAVVDRVNTTGAVWLGLTVACAQCHTHKYDPITIHEYYQLFAFFNSNEDVNRVTPTLSLATPEQQAALAELDSQLKQARTDLKTFETQQAEAQAQIAAATTVAEEQSTANATPSPWSLALETRITSQAGAEFESLEDGSYLVSGPNGPTDTYTLKLKTGLKQITAVRLETLTHPSLPKQGPGRAGNGNFVLNRVRLHSEKQSADWTDASADHSQPNYPVTHAIDDDPDTGWAINVTQGNMNVDRTAQFLCQPLAVESAGEVTLELEFGPKPAGYNIGRLRVSLTSADPSELLSQQAELARLQQRIEKLDAERKKLVAAIPTTMVMRDLREPRATHVLIRGDFLRKGDPVSPGTPAVLPTVKAEDSERKLTRLDLARWLVDPEHPLTARVFVNRVWMRYFPHGLVETENDFGMQGSLPTHPELLDWLAAEFMERGWSMKELHRMILHSATYRQSSTIRPELAEIDPENKLLARQSRLRVDAEIVRDLGLAASGLLHPQIGGPSVYPPQPEGVYAFTQRRANWPTSTGPDRYRRGMYTFFMRSAPHPLLTTFDTPGMSTTCTSRTRSNTPLQALTLANDQAMQEVYEALGKRMQNQAGSEAQRIEWAYRLCFSRLPTETELTAVRNFLERMRSEFRAEPATARALLGEKEAIEPELLADLAAYTLTARLLLNLDEFITRE